MGLYIDNSKKNLRMNSRLSSLPFLPVAYGDASLVNVSFIMNNLMNGSFIRPE
jgi:hypothetical protein